MAASTHQTRLKRDRRKAVFLFLSKEGYADRYGTESINGPPYPTVIVSSVSQLPSSNDRKRERCALAPTWRPWSEKRVDRIKRAAKRKAIDPGAASDQSSIANDPKRTFIEVLPFSPIDWLLDKLSYWVEARRMRCVNSYHLPVSTAW